MSSYEIEVTDDKHKIDHSEYGVVKNGFRRKTFAEAMADRIERAQLVFGVNVDTSSTSVFGKLIRNAAWDEVAIYEKMEDIYYSPFVNFASGNSLDGVGQYLTISRRPATKSNGTVTIFGTSGINIPKGFIVASDNGVLFETIEEKVIPDVGYIDVKVISIGAGRNQNVGDNKINKIQNPIYGVNKVINKDKTEGGLDQETDDEFRERYKKSYSRVGGSTVPAITAALLDIDEVVDCEVRENVTMIEQDGIPPKSFECYVYGGKDDDIVNAIYQNKAAGIQAYGDIVKPVTDNYGNTQYIGFSRATPINITVDIKLKKGRDYKGDDLIRRAIISYIGGIDGDGIEHRGLKLGEDVIYSKVNSMLFCAGGVDDADITLMRDGGMPVKTNVEIERNEIAITSIDRIRISYE